MDMLLLPLLSRIFSVLQQPITGTDEAHIHRRLKDSYLSFFTALMNANLDGIFITSRNNAEFENVLSALLKLASDSSDGGSQRLAISFFARSVIAWGTSPKAAAAPSVFADSASSEKSKAVANGTSAPTNHHATPREERAAQALPGYETFIYQRLLPLCFEVPANPKFNVRGGQAVSGESVRLRMRLTGIRYFMRLLCFCATRCKLEGKKPSIFCSMISFPNCNVPTMWPINSSRVFERNNLEISARRLSNLSRCSSRNTLTPKPSDSINISRRKYHYAT